MSYNRLSIEEKYCIYQFLNLGMSIRKIAQVLKRSPSRISREIKRNSSKIKASRGSYAKYFPVKANDKYLERREDCHRESKFSKDVIDYLTIKINEHWSSEQIVNRSTILINQIPSTSTIYRLIHAKKLPKTSMKNLRRKGKFKRPTEERVKFNDKGRTIKKRPKEIYKRQELSHREADTVEFGRIDHKRKSGYCFITLAERKSRYYIAILVENRKSKNITKATINALKDLPKELVKTITFDRGKEFSECERIEKELGCKTYFCDPYCVW